MQAKKVKPYRYLSLQGLELGGKNDQRLGVLALEGLSCSAITLGMTQRKGVGLIAISEVATKTSEKTNQLVAVQSTKQL